MKIYVYGLSEEEFNSLKIKKGEHHEYEFITRFELSRLLDDLYELMEFRLKNKLVNEEEHILITNDLEVIDKEFEDAVLKYSKFTNIKLVFLLNKN